MTKRDYVKPNCVEFGNLTEDTQMNIMGNGRDGAYPDKPVNEELPIAGDAALFS